VNHLSRRYNSILNSILPDLENHDLSNLILKQFLSLERHCPHLNTRSPLTLDTEQYRIYSTLCNACTKENILFFLTGSAGTGKKFMLLQIITFLQSKNKKYLLLAFTGVAAQNVGGRTIHSAMKIRFHGGNYETLVYTNDNDESDLKEIDTILIDEISMVDGALFTFLSNTFTRIHKNNLIFGGIPTLVIGDLAQLPPINPHYVFRSQILSSISNYTSKTTRRSQILPHSTRNTQRTVITRNYKHNTIKNQLKSKPR